MHVHAAGPGTASWWSFTTGHPGGGLIPLPIAEVPREHGRRGVTHARPGFGESTRSVGGTVADVAADVAELTDHFGAGRFYRWDPPAARRTSWPARPCCLIAA